MSAETIVAAAIELNGEVTTLPPPARHHTIIMHLATREDSAAMIARPRLTKGRQGFVTSAGRFVGREEARELALRSGQVDCPLHGSMLFSEDLW